MKCVIIVLHKKKRLKKMELKIRGINFKNVYRYNSNITINTFNKIIEEADIDYKKNKGKSFYLIESGDYFIFSDEFGDITNYSVSKKGLISE